MKDGIAQSVLDAIGDTPLVALDRLTHGVDGRILAKLDYLNPGLSKKDRAAREIIAEAEADGSLRSGQTVVELTSGNMGTGLAIVCAVHGYPFVAVMSKGNTPERARMMRGLGAEVVLVDQAPGSTPGHVTGTDLALVEDRTRAIVAERGAFRADQFALRGNFLAHYRHTGPELWDQSGGTIDGFCDFVGTGGTFAGVTAALKERNAAIKCYAVEPDGAAVLAGRPATDPDHPIQGGGYAMADLAQMHDIAPDGFISVTGAEAIDATRCLAREEGIFAGYSSGANVAAALKLLAGDLKGGTVAVVLADSGLKYLSTDLWD